ncbi:hypothetical protein DEO72_LG6g1487 [Vigna unguiculata]|uniref:Transmembrane protein n=1 Tax=Vigna unguiculata TaxID=3917 RepID=A0A4D6M792_VIGUN|nr:hypothetical protein DEO72_LG6g1487 [Vigna unguiculata]
MLTNLSFVLRVAVVTLLGFAFPSRTSSFEARFTQLQPISRSVPLFSNSKPLPRAAAFRGWCRSTVLAYSREKCGEVRHSRPSEPVSLRRDLQKQVRAALELSLRRKLFPSEEPHLWVRDCLAQARRARLSKPCESLPASLSRSRRSESPPPKRGHSSRMSEGSWLERDSLRVALFFLVWLNEMFDLLRNSLGSLGEILRVVLQWSGRNCMAPVSGCPWWCPIYITCSGVSSSGVSRGIHHKCKHPLNPTKLYPLPRAAAFRGWCRSTVLAYSREKCGEVRHSRPSEPVSLRRDLQKQPKRGTSPLGEGLSRSGKKGSPKQAMREPPSVPVAISPKRESTA